MCVLTQSTRKNTFEWRPHDLQHQTFSYLEAKKNHSLWLLLSSICHILLEPASRCQLLEKPQLSLGQLQSVGQSCQLLSGRVFQAICHMAPSSCSNFWRYLCLLKTLIIFTTSSRILGHFAASEELAFLNPIEVFCFGFNLGRSQTI